MTGWIARHLPAVVLVALLKAVACPPAAAQFVDDFDDGPPLGWSQLTGDGDAVLEVSSRPGFLSVAVDATEDRHNIWWALLKRNVASAIDVQRLSESGQELRVEARVRPSHAPRRINLHVNTQRTTDFHSHLMEYDLADTTRWHTISMTTDGFDVRPGDSVNVQLALIDWGTGRYRLDVDYVRADVVDAASARPDVGTPVPYRPPVPDADTLMEAVVVGEDALVDTRFPSVNLSGWHAVTDTGRVPALTVGGTRIALLRWDLSAYAGRRVRGRGLLQLTTHALHRPAAEHDEFSRVRVVEILGGDPGWTEENVTLESLLQDRPLDEVINPQMIIDVAAAEEPGAVTAVTISRPVLQRLIDGRTRGLALLPLGPVSATFVAVEGGAGRTPQLLFNAAAQ